MKAVVAYCRVSTPEQKKGDTIKTQERKLTRYAETQNLNIVRWFSDNGYSGKDQNRPAFQLMIPYIEDNHKEIHWLFTRDIARLGRNALELMQLKVILTSYNLDLILAESGSMNLEDPYQELLYGNMANFAEFIRKVNILRVKEGLQRAIERGVKLGRPMKRLKKTPKLMALIKHDAPYNLIAKLYGVDWRTAKREVLRIKEEETAREAQLHQSAVARNPKVKKRR